jgi:multiple sugar transport system substrate-binding protein
VVRLAHLTSPRALGRWLWLGVWLVLATGCAPTQEEAGPEDEGVIRLTYWSSQNAQERELARRLTDAWNASHPDVQVTVQPLPAGQSSEEVLLAAIVAGTTPDLCSNIWPGIVSSFVRADGVVPLDRFASFDSLMQSRVPPEVLERFRAEDGHVYQIPWKTNPIMMLYNEGLFREAGVTEPPRTYSAYLDAAARVTADLDGDGDLDRWMGYRDIRPIWWQRYFDYYPFYIAASEGQTLFEGGEVAVDTAASDEVFAFFQEVYRRHYFPVTTFQGSAFLARKIATEFTGPWNVAFMEENAPADLAYDYAPLPTPDDFDGPVYTYGDYKNIAIFSSSEHPEAAWRFAQYLVSKEADRLLLELTKQIPVRNGLLTDSTYAEFFARNPKVRPFAEQAAYTRGVDDVESLQEVLDAVAQQFEAAVYDVRTPREATEQAVERIELIHAWSQ